MLSDSMELPFRQYLKKMTNDLLKSVELVALAKNLYPRSAPDTFMGAALHRAFRSGLWS